MGLLLALEQRLARVHPLALALALLAASFLRAGVWYIPNMSSILALALNPFANPYEGQAQYLFTNWLGPFVAWLLHVTALWQFTLLHAAFSALFLATVAVSLHRALPLSEWRKAICIFALLPVSWTHLYWIGYDSLTLALMALALATLRTPWLAALCGIGLGLQHFEQGLIGFASLAFVIAVSPGARSPIERRNLVGAGSVLVGIGLGKLILRAIVRLNHIDFKFDRSSYLVSELHQALLAGFLSFPMVLASFLGVGWVVAFCYLGGGRCRWALGLVLLGAMALSFTVLDNTRVFACVTFPALAYCCLYSRDWLEQVPLRLVAALLLAWLATPWIFSWGAKPRPSVLPYDLIVVSHDLLGRPGAPDAADRPLWPFSH